MTVWNEIWLIWGLLHSMFYFQHLAKLHCNVQLFFFSTGVTDSLVNLPYHSFSLYKQPHFFLPLTLCLLWRANIIEGSPCETNILFHSVTLKIQWRSLGHKTAKVTVNNSNKRKWSALPHKGSLWALAPERAKWKSFVNGNHWRIYGRLNLILFCFSWALISDVMYFCAVWRV